MTDENGLLTNNAIGINIKTAIFFVQKYWLTSFDR